MDNRRKYRKLLIYLLISVIALCTLYWVWELPSLTPEMALRRQETGQLIGPSQIILRETVDYNDHDRIILGETDHGYVLFEYKNWLTEWDDGDMTYIAKDENRPFFVPNRARGLPFQEIIPVYVIQENPQAAIARLTLTTESEKYGDYCQTYRYEALSTQGTLFLFKLEIVRMQPKLAEFWTLRLQRDESVGWPISGAAILELLDRDGNLLETHTLNFPTLT
ncbi:MAG: hypothetical protein IKC09_08010 [Oscillospiraceae bacterium]|nr:hypothetical protein [Oscillospiraceae bacterium]